MSYDSTNLMITIENVPLQQNFSEETKKFNQKSHLQGRE